MQNKELNLCEILKDCPKGTELYTPLYGVCNLYSVSDKFVTVDYVGTVKIICNETFFPNWMLEKAMTLIEDSVVFDKFGRLVKSETFRKAMTILR